jgi:hypothetical protein
MLVNDPKAADTVALPGLIAVTRPAAVTPTTLESLEL